jgi:hypothetical protein
MLRLRAHAPAAARLALTSAGKIVKADVAAVVGEKPSRCLGSEVLGGGAGGGGHSARPIMDNEESKLGDCKTNAACGWL